jgi:2-keto-4-pentenoate hydratase
MGRRSGYHKALSECGQCCYAWLKPPTRQPEDNIMSDAALDPVVDFLFKMRRDASTLALFPAHLLPRDEATAYRAQDKLTERLLPESGKIVGYKIGLTSDAIRKQTGLDHPIVGPIFQKRLMRTPASVALKSYGRLGLELELCVTLGKDLPAGNAPYTEHSVADAVSGISTAFELIDDHGADYSKLSAMQLIADGSWQAGVLMAPPVVDWQKQDRFNAPGWVKIDGKETARGKAGDAMGQCFAGLAWTANQLAPLGRSLKAGMVVMTGSIVPTQFPKSGNTVVGTIQGFGEISLTLT